MIKTLCDENGVIKFIGDEKSSKFGKKLQTDIVIDGEPPKKLGYRWEKLTKTFTLCEDSQNKKKSQEIHDICQQKLLESSSIVENYVECFVAGLECEVTPEQFSALVAKRKIWRNACKDFMAQGCPKDFLIPD